MVESLLSKIDAAWAAGFFDGEGCFTMSGPYPHASIGQCAPELLLRFQSIVGVGNVTGPYIKKQKNWNPMWEYNASGLWAVKSLYEVISENLGSAKKNKYEEIMVKAKPVARPGYCRKNLHLLESDKMSDGRCGPCRRESNRAAWNRNGRVAP